MMSIFADGETMKVSGSGFTVDRYMHMHMHMHMHIHTHMHMVIHDIHYTHNSPRSQ